MNKENLVVIPKRLKGEDGYKVSSVRIKEDTIYRIDKISSLTGRSRNELIGKFLEYALEHCEVDDAKEK